MATGMEFGLLGPLTVRHSGVQIPMPSAKQRVVLAALLLNANRLIPLDELTEALWGASPPASARATMQNYVMRLRRSLGGGRITTQPGGYVISVDPGELDVSRFEALLGSARAAARDGLWEQAAGQAGAALALWRGEPLAGVDSEFLAAREVPRLAERRLQALETRIDADLRLGRQSEVIGELRQLAAAHPLRERFHALLMLALYRDGRQGEALAAYARARQVLIEELGTEPGTELRELHQQILTADPALDVPKPTRPVAGGPEPAIPRELPGAIRHFTGRGGELKELTALLDQNGEDTPTVVISAIGGTAGVGKTALAVQWAHQVADRFPDGQLYVNLRGYDPGQPVTAADALAAFLRSLGVAGPDIPAEEDERAARYRSLLAGRRMLVVLDNAGAVEQVRPLLPGSSACVVVVTSRDALAGLVARDGAHRLDLDLLPLPEAVSLLRALIGDRVDTDPTAAVALAQRCARLPLALRVAAELTAARPHFPLVQLASELADQQRQLDLLEAGGDPRTAVRAAFSWSYRHLDPDAARAFRLVSLHPGADFDPYAVAALTATTAGQAGRLLEVLARAHLVQAAGAGRYCMHDLLRAYARERAACDGEDERRAALTRLFDHYLCTAATAIATLYPAERRRLPHIPPPAAPTPPVSRQPAARAWLDTERANLVAAIAHTADHGWPGHAVRLAVSLYRYLEYGGHYPEAIIIYTHALNAARQDGDRSSEAAVLNSLGAVRQRQGRYQQAFDCLRQALSLCRETGDLPGQARAQGNLGIIEFHRGDCQQAADRLQKALAIYRETGDRAGEARQLHNLGSVDLRQGRFPQAIDRYQQALALSREIGDRAGESYALADLGDAEQRQGRYSQAVGHLQEALPLCRATGNRGGEANALVILGDAEQRQGKYQQAIGHLQQALALSREIGSQPGEAEALNGLAEVFLAIGQPEYARTQHIAALGLASQIGDKAEQARAHNGLAGTYHATGDLGQARHHWQHALSLYTELGAPEAGQVRAQLTAAGGADHAESHGQSE